MSSSARAAVALAVLLGAKAAGAQSADDVSPEALETVRRLFREGVTLADEGRWDDARERFARVFAIRPAPMVRFNLALACERSGHWVEALEHYRQFLRDPAAQSDRARVAAAERSVETLSPRLSTLRVSVTGDAPSGFSLDGRAQTLSLLGEDVAVDPGHHVVEVDGRGGDRQRHEGTLLEGERVNVEVELTPRATTEVTGPPRPRAFGHWATRPGPGGRWVDWTARDRPLPEGPFTLRPLTVSVGGGYGWTVGAAEVGARWFPLKWIGAEAVAGWSPSHGFGGALFAHLRWVPSARAVFAPSVFFGPTLHATAMTVVCENDCPTDGARDVTVPTAGFSGGVAGEFRLGARLALRLRVGFRTILNPSDFRGAVEQEWRCDDTGSRAGVADPCALAQGNDAGRVGGFAALDLGWRL
ncbi:MAG: tetratricopeptide repeat protein [Polyangiales bacterium]